MERYDIIVGPSPSTALDFYNPLQVFVESNLTFGEWYNSLTSEERKKAIDFATESDNLGSFNSKRYRINNKMDPGNDIVDTLNGPEKNSLENLQNGDDLLEGDLSKKQLDMYFNKDVDVNILLII